MTRLTATDALFVYADSSGAPMNMGTVLILRLPSGYRGDFFAKFKRFVADRIEYLPKLTMRLAADKVGLPHWVESDDFELDYHVRRTRVRSHDPVELFRKLGRLQHAPLDRSKPLFMFYVIEGLKDGRIAIVQKFHHAFADGKTAIRVMNLFSDEGLLQAGRTDDQEYEGSGSWLERLLAGSVEDVRRTFASVPGILSAAGNMVGEGSKDMLDRLLSRPVTIFNDRLSQERMFALRSWPMREMTDVRRAAGLTFNDIGLVMYGGALRRYLDEVDALPEQSLVCNVPVALNAEGAAGGNAVLAMWIPMGTHLSDREERIRFVKGEADSCKDFLASVTDGATAGQGIQLPSYLVRLIGLQMGSEWISNLRAPPGNVAMSSVPSPAEPIHVAGAEVESLYGLPMVVARQAVSMTFTSYANHVVIGILCCEKALPDPDRIFDYMEDELKALKNIYLKPVKKERTAKSA